MTTAFRPPEVPPGVRPVVGTHQVRIPISRAERELRRVANLLAVARLRAHPRASTLPVAPRYPKLFVVGCPRSGTSWVQRILGDHPRIVTSQESHAYENIFRPVTSGGRTSVAAWTKVLHRHDLEEREARWVGLHWWVNRATLVDLIEWAFAAEGISDADAGETVIQAVFDSYFLARGHAGQVLLEKTPGHLAYADRILRRYPEAKVVEVLRDGRDVCVSMQMQALTMSWPPATRRDQITAWVRAVDQGATLRADPELRDRVHLVRYEELKAAPEREITRLFEFAELDTHPRALAEITDRANFRHLGDTGDGRHSRRGEVGDWQNHFTPDDEALFRALAGDTFLAAGYRF
jgi:Sulfotransferase family